MKNLIRTVLCLSLALVAGCSSYGKRFALASRSDVKHRLHEGAYAGRWTSAKNSTWGGDLRCILTAQDDCACTAGSYRADFHAKWHGLSSKHSVVLHTRPAAGKKSDALDFAGTSRLHTIIGAGTYMCKGTMDSRMMRACYDVTYDKGMFEMTRVTSKDDAKGNAR